MGRGEMVADSDASRDLPAGPACLAAATHTPPQRRARRDECGLAHTVVTMDRPSTDPARRWTLRRNCSLTPRQVAYAYAVLGSASFAVGLAFLLRGVWVVLAFTLVEQSLVGLALLAYARHATDHETICLTDAALLVECVEADRHRSARFDPAATRVVVDGGRRAVVRLESRGVAVEVGRFVDDARRRQLARELRLALRHAAMVR